MSKITRTDKFISAIILPFFPHAVKPNHITFLRLIATPFIVFFLFKEKYLLGGLLFVIFALSDAVDGAMARTRNQITGFGEQFDPAADKFLIGSVALVIVYKFLGGFLALTMVAIELMFIIGALWRKVFENKVVAADGAGKTKMILQSFGISFLILYAIFSWPWLLILAGYTIYAAIVFALLSLLVYGGV